MQNIRLILKENDIEFDALELLESTNVQNIYGFKVYRNHAVQVWHKLRNLWNKTSYWPVLFFDKLEVQNLLCLDKKFYRKTRDEIINLAEALDIDLWLKRRAKKYSIYQNPYRCPPEQFKESDNWGWHSNASGFLNIASYNDWGIVVPDYHLMVLIPVEQKWQVAATLALRVWNNGMSHQKIEAAQEEEVHAALIKKWEYEYGAELLSVYPDTSNSLEFKVMRPPKERTEALRLAWEQFVYCDDIIYQGASSLDHLAESLIGNERWVFGWD